MLQIGLTGGIGSGKSTVASLLAELGGHLVDADALAREVVEPGTPGLAQVQEAFGPGVLTEEGALDRSELAARVFGDEQARARLNAIVHPLVRSRTEAIVADLPEDAVVIQDVPLIVENDLAADYHLVVVVGTDRHVRTLRLQRDRGMTPTQVEARMRAQATDEDRRRVADVWIDNGADPEATRLQVAHFWHTRAIPYAENLAAGRPAPRSEHPVLSRPPGPPRTWAVQAEYLLERLLRAGGDLIRTADHVGSTAVPGLLGQDVIDLQLGVDDPAAAEDLTQRLRQAGFPGVRTAGRPQAPSNPWRGLAHRGADPGRAVNVCLKTGQAARRRAVLLRDWLRDDAVARQEYAALKSALIEQGSPAAGYRAGKDRWLEGAVQRMQAWADHTGWSVPEGRPPG